MNDIKALLTASRVSHEIRLDAAHPDLAWESTKTVSFSSDWQGQNPDPALTTEVRALWSPMTFYLRFVCHYRELFLFDDSAPNGRRDHLWDRDVAEAFLQPKPSPERYYKEFEIAPNGMWIDLEIFPDRIADLKSGLKRSVHVDKQKPVWAAEIGIPMKAITSNFDPRAEWRANFYRVEGRAEPRRYLAWQPTRTPKPNFHVPESFGVLRFEE